MRKTLVVSALSLIGAFAVASAQAPKPPVAGPEHKRLAYFAGTWNFSGTAKDSPMGPGGPITFKEVCELMDGGFALVCRSDGKSPMGPVKSASIMSYDADKKTYTFTAAESNSPVFTALGQVDGPAWTWRTETNMGGSKMYTRVTVREGGPKAYDFRMELSMDGKTFAPLVEGKATR
jgi:hypothetical protein